MVEVAEIAEDCPRLGEAFQEIVSHGGLVALIFKYDDEYVVEMLGGRRGSVSGGDVLRKAEIRDGPKEERRTCKSAAVPITERHASSQVLCGLENLDDDHH